VRLELGPRSKNLASTNICPQAGVIHFTNGDRYEGEWSCGAKNGTGTYRCANGVVYEGRWKEDMRHGCFSVVFVSFICAQSIFMSKPALCSQRPWPRLCLVDSTLPNIAQDSPWKSGNSDATNQCTPPVSAHLRDYMHVMWDIHTCAIIRILNTSYRKHRC
jgi:hypothetical protein